MPIRPPRPPKFVAAARLTLLVRLATIVMISVSSAPAQNAPAPVVPAAPLRTILFFGDSLTAGYGLDDPGAEAFPALIGRRLKDAGLPYQAVNAGVSGDTTAGGLRRIDWLLRRPVDILVLELGGNDGLRGVSPDESQRNLQAIIDKTRARNPGVRVVVAGMQMPPNFGADFVARFAGIYPALAAANPGSQLIPFVLQGVGGIASLNQRDQIHPTAEGHRIIADLIWKTLEPMVQAP